MLSSTSSFLSPVSSSPEVPSDHAFPPRSISSFPQKMSVQDPSFSSSSNSLSPFFSYHSRASSYPLPPLLGLSLSSFALGNIRDHLPTITLLSSSSSPSSSSSSPSPPYRKHPHTETSCEDLVLHLRQRGVKQAKHEEELAKRFEGEECLKTKKKSNSLEINESYEPHVCDHTEEYRKSCLDREITEDTSEGRKRESDECELYECKGRESHGTIARSTCFHRRKKTFMGSCCLIGESLRSIAKELVEDVHEILMQSHSQKTPGHSSLSSSSSSPPRSSPSVQKHVSRDLVGREKFSSQRQGERRNGEKEEEEIKRSLHSKEVRQNSLPKRLQKISGYTSVLLAKSYGAGLVGASSFASSTEEEERNEGTSPSSCELTGQNLPVLYATRFLLPLAPSENRLDFSWNLHDPNDNGQQTTPEGHSFSSLPACPSSCSSCSQSEFSPPRRPPPPSSSSVSCCDLSSSVATPMPQVPSCESSSSSSPHSSFTPCLSLMGIHCQLDDFFASCDISASRAAHLCAKSPYEASTALAKELSVRRSSLYRRHQQTKALSEESSSSFQELLFSEEDREDEEEKTDETDKKKAKKARKKRGEEEVEESFSLETMNDGESLGARLLRRYLIEAILIPLRSWNLRYSSWRNSQERSKNSVEKGRSLTWGEKTKSSYSFICMDEMTETKERTDRKGEIGMEKESSEDSTKDKQTGDEESEGMEQPASSPITRENLHDGDVPSLAISRDEEIQAEISSLLSLHLSLLPEKSVICLCIRGVARLQPSQWLQASRAISMILADFDAAASVASCRHTHRRHSNAVYSSSSWESCEEREIESSCEEGEREEEERKIHHEKEAEEGEEEEDGEQDGQSQLGEGGDKEEEKEEDLSDVENGAMEKNMKIGVNAYTPSLEEKKTSCKREEESNGFLSYDGNISTPRLLAILEWNADGEDEDGSEGKKGLIDPARFSSSSLEKKTFHRQTEEEESTMVGSIFEEKKGERRQEKRKTLYFHVKEWAEEMSEAHRRSIRVDVIPREDFRLLGERKEDERKEEYRRRRGEEEERGEKEEEGGRGTRQEREEKEKKKSDDVKIEKKVAWDEGGRENEEESKKEERKEEKKERGSEVRDGKELKVGAIEIEEKNTSKMKDLSYRGEEEEKRDCLKGNEKKREIGRINSFVSRSSAPLCQEEIIHLLEGGSLDDVSLMKKNKKEILSPKRPCMTYLCGNTYLPAPPLLFFPGGYTPELLFTSPDFLQHSPYGHLLRQVEELVYLPLLLRLSLLSASSGAKQEEEKEREREGKLLSFISPSVIPGPPASSSSSSTCLGSENLTSEPVRDTVSLQATSKERCFMENLRGMHASSLYTHHKHLRRFEHRLDRIDLEGFNRHHLSHSRDVPVESLQESSYKMKEDFSRLRRRKILHEQCRRLLILPSSSSTPSLPPPPRLLIHTCHPMEKRSSLLPRQSRENKKSLEEKERVQKKTNIHDKKDQGEEKEENCLERSFSSSSSLYREKALPCKSSLIEARDPKTYPIRVSPQQALQVLGEKYSHAIQTYFLPVSALASPYVGQTEEKLRRLLRQAVEASPSVLVLVGIDQLAAKRHRGGDERAHHCTNETLHVSTRHRTQVDKKQTPTASHDEKDVEGRNEIDKNKDEDPDKDIDQENTRGRSAEEQEEEAKDQRRFLRHRDDVSEIGHTKNRFSSTSMSTSHPRQLPRGKGTRPFQRRLLASLLVGLDEVEDYRRQYEESSDLSLCHSSLRMREKDKNSPDQEQEEQETQGKGEKKEKISFSSCETSSYRTKLSSDKSVSRSHSLHERAVLQGADESSRERRRQRAVGMAVVGVCTHSTPPECLDEAISRAGRLDTWIAWESE